MNIFCLEGEWDGRLDHQESVLPALEFLKSSPAKMNFIHRRVASVEQLSCYLKTFGKGSYKTYGIVYLALHGRRGRISFSNDEELTLKELSQLDGAAKAFKDRHIHFSSCDTLRAASSTLCNFKSTTQASTVSGYSKYVDFVESMIFDLAYFNGLNLEEGKNIEELLQPYAGLRERLGFEMI